ncbi:MAG TPA: lysylphosphatidylglycerol synthase transmembrane domain-containing protein, partial [Flavobacteriaceae bacterium]|nr:lysylphosphatidylglycerol synthase transmembrane domain-containing protein [Flavobacteriaceae bacterium]
MENKFKKLLFIILPIALGVFLIWYSLSKLTTTDIDAIKEAFKNTNYWWVVVSLFLGVLSHISRAHRWKYLLKPLGYKPRFLNSFMAVMMGYLLNLVIPRSGEVARAGSISKYEKTPFSSALGTIVAERVADLIMLFLIIGIALFFQTDLISSYLFNNSEASSIWLKV